jgi:hypothetical protein
VVANPARVSDLPIRRAHITAALTTAGWPAPLWLETTPRDPGGGRTRAAVAAGVDVVFAAGGDGTVRACLTSLRGTDTALAVLPFGTGNLLAANFDVPTDLPAPCGLRPDHTGAASILAWPTTAVSRSWPASAWTPTCCTTRRPPSRRASDGRRMLSLPCGICAVDRCG